ALSSRRQRKGTFQQPIRRFDERCAGCGLAFVSINHLEQNSAQQLSLDERTVKILGDGQIELELHAKAGLANSQVSRRDVREVRPLQSQIDYNGNFPFVALAQKREEIGLGLLRQFRDRSAQFRVCAVNGELSRGTNTVCGQTGANRLQEDDG